jgi:hypothetical protein
MEREGIVKITGGYDPPDPGDINSQDIIVILLREGDEAQARFDLEWEKRKKRMDVIISNFDLMRAKLATEARSQAYLADIKKLNQGNKAYFARLEPRVNMDIITGKITILPNQVVEQSVQLKAQNVQLPTQGANQVKLTDGVKSVLSCVEDIPKFQQEPANLSVLDPNSNPYEPKFSPSVVEGEGVRLGSSSKPILQGVHDVRVIRNMKFADLNPKVCYQLLTDGKREDFTDSNLSSLEKGGVLYNIAENLDNAIIKDQEMAIMPNNNASGGPKYTPDVTNGVKKDNVFTLLNTSGVNNEGCGSSYEPPDPGDKASKYTPNVNGKKDNVFTLLNTGGVNGVKVRCGSSYEPPDPGDQAGKGYASLYDSPDPLVIRPTNGFMNNVKEGCGSSYEPPDPGDQAGKGYASLYDSPDPLIARPTNGFLNNEKEGCDWANSETIRTTFELSMNGSSYEPPDPGDQAGKGYASLYDSPDKGEIYQPISIPFGCYFSPGKYLEYIDEFPPRYISCKGGG